MDIETAIGVLEEYITIPAFFNRLAQYNLQPVDQNDALGYVAAGRFFQKAASEIIPIGKPDEGQSLNEFVQKYYDPRFADPTVREAMRTLLRAQKGA